MTSMEALRKASLDPTTTRGEECTQGQCLGQGRILRGHPRGRDRLEIRRDGVERGHQNDRDLTPRTDRLEEEARGTSTGGHR